MDQPTLKIKDALDSIKSNLARAESDLQSSSLARVGFELEHTIRTYFSSLSFIVT